MLKKAGFVAVASVASLVTVAPLAFAGGTGDVAVDQVKGEHVDGDNGGHKGHGHDGGNQNSSGFVNGFNGNNVNVPIQLCNNDVQGQVGLVPVQDIGENPSVTGQGVAGLLFGSAEGQQSTQIDNARTCGQTGGGAGYGNN